LADSLKRFLAPEWVFIFGMAATYSSRRPRERPVEQRPLQDGRNMTMMLGPSKAVLSGEIDNVAPAAASNDGGAPSPEPSGALGGGGGDALAPERLAAAAADANGADPEAAVDEPVAEPSDAQAPSA
jgi:translation initiation factor IF-3